MSRVWEPRHVLALVALVVVGVVGAPVAVHAAGQLVTIVDSSTNNPAKVTAGALRVDTTPGRPVGGRQNAVRSATSVLIGRTTATVQLTALSLVTWHDDHETWTADVYQVGLTTATETCTGATGAYNHIGTVSAGQGTVGQLLFPSSVTLKSPAGASGWCLIAYPHATTTTFYAYLHWNGSITTGALSAPTASAAQEPVPAPAPGGGQPAPRPGTVG